MLKAERHPIVTEMILVKDESLGDANVVYKFNEKHNVGTRTNHAGSKPSMKAIRDAIASL